MAKLSARRAALDALQTWRTKTRFADTIISQLLAEANLTTSDRGFALELFYGVLRNLTLLDFWIDCLRPSSVEVELRDILRLGVYQLFCLETPEHAAVYESVELAPKRGRGLINGILRSASRQKADLRAKAQAQPLFVRRSHPEFLVERWQRHFGSSAAEKLCAWNNEPPPVYGRVNRLRISGAEFLKAYSCSKPLPERTRENGIPTADFVEFETFPTNALNRGHCYIQDPSTAIACRLLDPQPGEKILDVCAAPGGKTSYLAEMMNNDGLIVACDREPERIQILSENVKRLGLEIVRVLPCDWESNCLNEQVQSIGPFDRILVDAPCSNTGVMRRRVDVRWRLQTSDFLRMQKRQMHILRAIFSLLRPGGSLVYSTCSLESEENEQTMRGLIAELPVLKMDEEKHSLPFRDGFDGAYAARLIHTGNSPA